MKTQKTRPLDQDLKLDSLAPNKLSVSNRSWKRNAEGTHSDKEYVSETNIMKTSMLKKVKFQQPTHPATQSENVKLAKRYQVSFSFLFTKCIVSHLIHK